jgi:hypothetical protein
MMNHNLYTLVKSCYYYYYDMQKRYTNKFLPYSTTTFSIYILLIVALLPRQLA